MNRAELDALFAKAEDVLTDWHGSDDSADTAPVRAQHTPLVDEQLDPILRPGTREYAACQRLARLHGVT